MNDILDFAANIHKRFFIGGMVVFVILVILMSLSININYLLILLGLILSFFTGAAGSVPANPAREKRRGHVKIIRRKSAIREPG